MCLESGKGSGEYPFTLIACSQKKTGKRCVMGKFFNLEESDDRRLFWDVNVPGIHGDRDMFFAIIFVWI